MKNKTTEELATEWLEEMCDMIQKEIQPSIDDMFIYGCSSYTITSTDDTKD